MKLQFDSDLGFQRSAIDSIIEALEGQPSIRSNFSFESSDQLTSEQGVPNPILLDRKLLLDQVQKVQRQNGLKVNESLKTTSSLGSSVPNLTIEMETGTGKTYVYLRTLFELEKKYGYKKFIILVPSIAIREGVLTSIKMTKDHFHHLYQTPFEFFPYDSKKLGEIRQFAQNQTMQIMILNTQAIVKDFTEHSEIDIRSNVMHRRYDRLEGRKPIDFIQAVKPVLVLDEPQSIDNTPRAKEAISKLAPGLILRYSATHRTAYNLLYRLDPVAAYDQKLVKRIEVASVITQSYYNEPYIRLLGITSSKGGALKAQVEIQQEQQSGFKNKIITIEYGSNLYSLSGEREIYRDYRVDGITNGEAQSGFITFSNGKKFFKGQISGLVAKEIQKKQIIECVKTHFEKALAVKDGGERIKILSLFFIDRVSNYRNYDEGTQSLGEFGRWFEDAFKEYQQKPEFKNLIPHPVEKVHDGYFAKDRQKRPKDTSGQTAEDTQAYELIMRDKEKLLSLEQPLQFIFSHSALKEGWDNPNVFQICTLNRTTSDTKKRQEIGRGLRLPVNSEGIRIGDESVNCLTVIANESYDSFAKALQTEIEEDSGQSFKNRIQNKYAKRQVHFNKKAFLSEDFQILWKKIRHKTRYSISFNSKVLIDKASCSLKKLDIVNPTIILKKGEILREKNMESKVREERDLGTIKVQSIPDLVRELQKHIFLTHEVLVAILRQSNCLSQARHNPEIFIREAALRIKNVMQDITARGIKYEKLSEHVYELDCIQWAKDAEIMQYCNRLYEVQQRDKSIYSHILCDSDFEHKYAEKLDVTKEIKLFVKLPSWFKVDTPVGSYNPDWAIVKENGKKVYLIKETKGVHDPQDLRKREALKLSCGEKHFQALDVEFKKCFKNFSEE